MTSTNSDQNARILASEELIVLDLAQFRKGTPAEVERYLADLRRSASDLGFLCVANHGVDLDLLDRCYELSERFFALPLADKMELRYDQIDQKKYSDIGYFPYRIETAQGSEMPDLKEMFHVGQDVREGHRLSEYYATNVWPRSMPQFRAPFDTLFEQLRGAGDTIMRSIGRSYDMDAAYVDELIHEGNSMLRTLHYPPIQAGEEGMRAEAHTGIQLLGLQPRASDDGLQFLTPAGEWVAVDRAACSDYLLINLGDMLAYMLEDSIQATVHRVVNANRERARYAIVYFYHPSSVAFLCKRGDPGQQRDSLRAGDWLLKRLEEIKLFSGRAGH
ncbi:isopenicillin N synthase family dioxygenase [Haliangium ochraceum]|nr:isopenicillin N synthase family oxygenase [Haliangium ochraceum]